MKRGEIAASNRTGKNRVRSCNIQWPRSVSVLLGILDDIADAQGFAGLQDKAVSHPVKRAKYHHQPRALARQAYLFAGDGIAHNGTGLVNCQHVTHLQAITITAIDCDDIITANSAEAPEDCHDDTLDIV